MSVMRELAIFRWITRTGLSKMVWIKEFIGFLSQELSWIRQLYLFNAEALGLEIHFTYLPWGLGKT